MNQKLFIKMVVALALLLGYYINPATAQIEKHEVIATIFHKDSLFWRAYNSCDVETMGQYFTEDVEFYHDNNGPVFGLDILIGVIRNNLCSNSDFKLRREAVEGSVEVFPLAKGNDIYGAIITGEHVFYISEGNKAERLDGSGKFCQVWVRENNIWKMSRILSYDHGPATRYKSIKKR